MKLACTCGKTWNSIEEMKQHHSPQRVDTENPLGSDQPCPDRRQAHSSGDIHSRQTKPDAGTSGFKTRPDNRKNVISDVLQDKTGDTLVQDILKEVMQGDSSNEEYKLLIKMFPELFKIIGKDIEKAIELTQQRTAEDIFKITDKLGMTQKEFDEYEKLREEYGVKA